MNAILKFNQTADSKVYFSSDWHLNHNPKWNIPIWKSRGANSVTEMNDFVIDSINKTVLHSDVLWFLGDFCLNTNESDFESFLSRINCQNIYMIFGNHNSQVWNKYKSLVDKFYCDNAVGISGNFDLPGIESEIYPIKYKNLIFVGNYQEIYVDNKLIVLSHYPLSSWNSMARGSFHLHGHIHSEKNTYVQQGKTMDVGFDFHKRPLSFDEVFKLLDNVEIKHEGHH